jgi:voltage-gated potassium channel Kch
VTRISGWWRSVRWPVIGIASVTTLMLGAVGFQTHLAQDGVDPSLLESTYRSIQLFVLEWGGINAPIPGTLQVARFAAPLLAGVAAAQAVALLFRDEIARARLRVFGRRHVIVCGLGERGQALAANLLSEGWRVAGIDPLQPRRSAIRGVVWVEGDATEPATLRRAAIRRAAHVVALGPNDAVNAAIAHAAGALGKQSLTIHMQVSDARLAALLRAETLMSASGSRPILEFFDLGEAAASVLLDGLADSVDRVICVGISAMTEPLLVRIAVRRKAGAERCFVKLVAESSEGYVAGLWARHPGLNDRVDIEPTDLPALGAARATLTGPPPDLVIVTLDDETDGVSVGLEVAQVLKERPADGRVVQIVVVTQRSSSLAGLVDRVVGGDASIAFRSFDAISAVLDGALLTGGTVEAMARAIHAAYRAISPAEVAGPGSSGLPAWSELPAISRDASRAAARAVGGLLRAVGCDLVPLTRLGGEPLGFTPAEIELMAIMEHERWVAWKRDHGFVAGDERDRRHNPHMVGWFALDEQTRSRVRDAVALLPGVVEMAGQTAVRLDRSPARLLHEEYVARRKAAGPVDAGDPAMLSWDRLPETLKASNRDQVAHLRVKLLSIGCDVSPGPADDFDGFTSGELESMAVMEHDRWVAHRIWDGWTVGRVKDVTARTSPYLVPWADLTEEIREIDREFVRSIPSLVHAMGMHVARDAVEDRSARGAWRVSTRSGEAFLLGSERVRARDAGQDGKRVPTLGEERRVNR